MSLFSLRKKPSKATTISGNEIALYSIFNRFHTGIIKVEGRHLSNGHLIHFHDTIEFVEKDIIAHVSYGDVDVADYQAIEHTLLLRLDNVDVEKVVDYFASIQHIRKEELS